MLECAYCNVPIPDTAKVRLCINCWVKDNFDKQPCAWCYPGSAGNSFGSHGICAQHSEEMIVEAKTHQPIWDDSEPWRQYDTMPHLEHQPD